MLLLVRHGEATANAAGLLLGRSDVPLTDVGHAQAAALRARLGTARRLVSSPLRRAIDTASALDLGLPVEVDDRWIEVDYGAHEGEALAAVPAEVWRRWRSDPAYRPPGGESLADVGRRVRSACEELFGVAGPGDEAPTVAVAGGAGAGTGTGDVVAGDAVAGDVVVVSHVSPIKAAVAWALGVGDEVAWRLHLSTGSVTRIAWGPTGPLVHTFNWTPELRPVPA